MGGNFSSKIKEFEIFANRFSKFEICFFLLNLHHASIYGGDDFCVWKYADILAKFEPLLPCNFLSKSSFSGLTGIEVDATFYFPPGN